MSPINGRGADPAIAARLAEDMTALAHLVDAAAVATFIVDDVFTSAQRLMEALETMSFAAQQERNLYGDTT